MKCEKCGSYAINEHLHGREKGVDTNLCDVCYWRKRAECHEPKVVAIMENIDSSAIGSTFFNEFLRRSIDYGKKYKIILQEVEDE